jgi:hypothetical protein
MPALRKSARDRDFRSHHHRSSNTPHASPSGTPSDFNTDKKQRSITEWTEPQPQTLAPSFEEHGFARHGVLENMAPLGIGPRAKDKQRARALGEPPLRNALAGKGEVAFGDEVASTPELTPARDVGPDDTERHEEPMQPAMPVYEEEEDDDYEPAKPKKKAKQSKTPVRGKTPVQAKSPLKNGHSKSTSVSASPAVQAIQTPAPEEENAQRMQIAINDAISRANSDNVIIGTALRRLYEESKTAPDLVAVMESVIKNNSTDTQSAQFRRFIKRVKKEERRKSFSNGRRSSSRRSETFSSRQHSPRASSEVAPDDSVSAVHDLQYQQPIVPSSSDPAEASTKATHEALQSAMEKASPRASNHPFNSAPEFPAANRSTEGMPRQASKSPRKRQAVNGHRAPDSAIDADGAMSTAAQTPAARTPDTGQSDSELSDVNEEIVQKGPPESVQAPGKGTTPASAVAQKKMKSAATARAAKSAKGKNNVGKLFGKHAHKQQPPTAEQIAEEEMIWQERQELANEQIIRKFDHDGLPISDVRFDDEILETESLTDSQIAVGPPVDSNQPRRAGRVPNHGVKRFREDASHVSSPQPDAAAASRPSTPAVGPASKRIKLSNGAQAARTKRS